jgi:hypothetical protein
MLVTAIFSLLRFIIGDYTTLGDCDGCCRQAPVLARKPIPPFSQRIVAATQTAENVSNISTIFASREAAFSAIGSNPVRQYLLSLLP